MWSFIQDEILGMHWLNRLIGRIVETFGLDPASRIGGSIQFFFYDVIKIFVLLGMEKVMEYGIMTMPAIVVNETVVSAGKVLKAAEVEKLLKR